MRTASAAFLVAICSTFVSFRGHGLVAPAYADAWEAAKYHCPMHPSFVQDRKGDCPICGMKLVRVEGSKGGASEPSPAAMTVGPEKQNVLGIAVTPARRSAGTRALRLLGRVAPDEARLYRINAGAGGSIRDVSTVVTGSRVKKNQVLGSFYAPETIATTQLFILNTQGFARKKAQSVTEDPQGEKGDDDADVGKNNSSLYRANVQQRVIQLESFGVSAMQRDEIMREGRVPDTIKIVSPADGFVLARNVSPGQKFDRGFEFYRIADLRRVWVIADVFPQDAPHVRPGMRARVSAREQKITLPASVTEILPQFDAASRTLKVKLVLDNPGYVLRPDMFVDVSVAVDLPPGVVVPADAIVDSGLSKTVFVQSAPGVFEPRKVETGWRSGDQVEVVQGLSPGEQVVSSGTFFLDSETRLRSPASGAAAAEGTAHAPTAHGPSPLGGAGDHEPARARGGREETAQALAGSAP